MHRTTLLLTLLVLSGVALTNGCGRFRRGCTSEPPRRSQPSDRDALPDNTSPSREFDPIPSGDFPTTPGNPPPVGTRTETFSPTRPQPRLQDPAWPYLSIPDGSRAVDPSTSELPQPYEAKKRPLDESPRGPFWLNDDSSAQPMRPAPGNFGPRLLEPILDSIPHDDDTLKRSADALPTLPADVPQREARKPKVEIERESKSPEALGLMGYTMVPGLKNVTTGGMPSLEGLDWLKANKVRYVVFLHRADYDTAPAKQLCEARNMVFVSIPMEAASVAQVRTDMTVAVAFAELGPVYVCDDAKFQRAGMAWYAYFRRTLLISPDASAIRVKTLGFDPEAIPQEYKSLWDAVLAELKQ